MMSRRMSTTPTRTRSNSMSKWLSRVETRFMGTPLDIHPHDALLWAVRITAGEINYCDEQIARLSEDELFERPNESTWAVMPSGEWRLVEEKRDPEDFNRWVRWRQGATERLARFAKMALDAGVEERSVRLAEQQAALFSRYMEAVMKELDLSPDQMQRLGPAMRRHMALVEATEGTMN